MEKEKCIECISCMGEGDGITGHLIPKKDYGRCSLIKPKTFMVVVIKTTHAVIISKGKFYIRFYLQALFSINFIFAAFNN